MNIANPLELPVLVLNKVWQAMGEKTVRRAFEDMTSGTMKDNGHGVVEWVTPFRGMDVETDTDGTLLYANPVDWEQWIELPVRPGDDYIYTGRRYIRAPRIIIASNFDRTHVRPVRLTKMAIHKRDKYECQYCHKRFPLEELNVDHVVPQFHGGESTWTNLVCSCKKCNTRKGHKHNSEIGYRLAHEPQEPVPRIPDFTIKHPSWALFIPHAKPA